MVAPRHVQVLVGLLTAAVAVVAAGCSSPGKPRVAVTKSTVATTTSTTAIGLAPGPPGGVSTTVVTTAPDLAARPGALVAVTTAGQVVTLDPATGKPLKTLASGATGDQVSLTPGGLLVYFEAATGCFHQIGSVAVAGGVPAIVSPGSLPTTSPDGTLLAFARQPIASLTAGAGNTCPAEAYAAQSFALVIRVLATGAETVYPLPPAVVTNGLPLPIGHLSWSADSKRLAVSIASAQDNEGWGVYIFDRTKDRYYVPSAKPVPVAHPSYFREAVFLPAGKLFVDKVCCSGLPPKVTSDQLLIIDPVTGATSQQIAVGLTTVDHSSLDSDRTGRWLLYLSGGDLLLSQDGAKPIKLASGILAADW